MKKVILNILTGILILSIFSLVVGMISYSIQLFPFVGVLLITLYLLSLAYLVGCLYKLGVHTKAKRNKKARKKYLNQVRINKLNAIKRSTK